LSALAESEDERPEAPSASVLTARPVDHEGGSVTESQAPAKGLFETPAPSLMKLLRGSSTLRDMFTQVISVTEMN